MEFPVNLEMWQMIVAALLPGVVSFLKDHTWQSDVIKIAILFGVAIIVSAVELFIAGQFVVADLVATTLKIAFMATASYAWIWKPTGADQKVAKTFGVGKGKVGKR